MVQKIKNILIWFIFGLFTVIWTYPLIFRMNSSIFGDRKWLFDTLVAIYGTWLNKMACLGIVPLNFNGMIGYPFGVDMSCVNREPALEIPLLFLSLWKNEIFAFNIIILSGYLLSAITMFYLAFYLTRDKTASFLSGVIYAFSPYHSLQAFSHISLSVIQWMPLYILCLFKFGEKISRGRAVLCACIFLLVALSNYYYGYIMFIFTLVFFLVGFFRLYKQGISNLFNFIKKFMLMGLIVIAVLIPLNYRAITAVWKGNDFSREAEIYRHAPPLGDLFRYSAGITDYIRPSEYHPIFGKVDFLFIKPYSNPSRHWSEKTVFLGYVSLIFSLYFLAGWLKGRKRFNEDKYIYILFLSMLSAFLISLPPRFGFLPMPSFFLYKIFPMFRTYARFGILVILGISVFAGLGFKEIRASIKRRVLFTYTSMGLVLFEFIVIPPFRNVDFSKTPPVYEWIKGLPEGTAIAEYPLFSEIESDHYWYLFYQRIHRRPIFNGSPIDSLGDAIRREIRDIRDIRAARILSCLGIQYIVLHKDGYSEEELAGVDKNKGLEKITDFGDAVSYRITAVPGKIEMFFWKNFENWEKWDDGNYWIWADNNSAVWLGNTDKNTAGAEIIFKAVSFAQEREMQIYLNDGLIHKINISSSGGLDDVKEMKIALLLKPGSNILRFYSPQGGEVIDSILHNDDNRRVCFGFSELKLE